MAELIKVANVGDIPEDEAITVEVAGEQVAVFNVGGTYYAVSNTCPHAGGPLSEGWVDNHEVTCPWHGWSFQLDPAKSDESDGLCRYRVVVEDDEIKVEVPE